LIALLKKMDFVDWLHEIQPCVKSLVASIPAQPGRAKALRKQDPGGMDKIVFNPHFSQRTSK
jgi:hypothetical protein